MTQLAGFDQQGFLQDYWQKAPLLIPGALDFDNPLSPEELAGLALEDDVEARIIRQRGETWELDNGPFSEQSFDADGPWTLLVQAVDQYVPAVTALRELVQFLPSWRLDDIMVSYATDGGGVGPHYDNYDVFLLQGLGQRRWRLGQRCNNESALRDSNGLRILAEFDTEADYTLSPGDILYVPPGVAHWGEAVGPCMTYSIGFRAPRLNDMVSRRVDGLLEQMDTEQFYSDPAPHTGKPGEITDAALRAALEQIEAAMRDASDTSDWFGELVTETRGTPELPPPGSPLPDSVVLDPMSRIAWRFSGSGIDVYGNGHSLAAAASSATILSQLCAGEPVNCIDLDAGDGELLQSLWNIGCLADV